MRFLKSFVVAFAILVSACGTVFAADWTVARVTLPAKYSMDGKSWADVVSGMKVPNAAWINTGERGRVLLTRNKDTMMIGAYTLVTSFKADRSGKMTEVRQQFGDVEIDVEKRGYPQMRVVTPFMAAVIKGTRFKVHSDNQKATLSVSRGLVEVIDMRNGARADIGDGGMAQVNSAPAEAIVLSGTNTTQLSALVPGKGNANGIAVGNGKAYGLTKASSNNDNGTGNAGGNGNGNGNGNAGGNGKSNAGGNGNGNGNAGGNGVGDDEDED